ncbi:unnamed protein product [Protopolystoma xenopodis]|uniref:Uncharacterized protein n=1 Tax=Protopolystoma xenopodis TaxID=117903 RepID=A0A448X394_9PLAT|nr:unnamed protein product [Protopolystoma xenopodis]
MGDLRTLYYRIAAPFKSKSTSRRSGNARLSSCMLIQRCLERAARTQLIYCSTGPQQNRRMGITNDELESRLESHLIDLFGVRETKRLLSRILLGVPYPPSVSIPISSNHSDELEQRTLFSFEKNHSPESISALPVHSTHHNYVKNGRQSRISNNCESLLHRVPSIGTVSYGTGSSETSSQVDSELTCQGG